jgi:hypothetical protein
MALSVEPADLGLSPGDGGQVWGVVMDTRFDDGGWHCLVVFAEGTTSLYTSAAFGIAGAGAHATVHEASVRLLDAAEQQLALFTSHSDSTLPKPGHVTIRALTFDEPLCVTALEDDLGHGRHPASRLFLAAHDVISEMRLVYEASG